MGSRRTYSYTGPPAGSTSESAGRDRWPPPSDPVTKRSYEKNESVVHATPLITSGLLPAKWYTPRPCMIAQIDLA